MSGKDTKPPTAADYDPRPWLKFGAFMQLITEGAWEPADRIFKATGWALVIATLDAFRIALSSAKLGYLVSALWIVWSLATIGLISRGVEAIWDFSSRRYGWPPSHINEKTNFLAPGVQVVAFLSFGVLIFGMVYANRAIAEIVAALVARNP